MRLRSLLFVPGDRPDRMEKALGAGADALILDLEDAVIPERKNEARQAVAAFLERPRAMPVLVRINPLTTDLADQDILAVASRRPEGIVLPKAEGGASVIELNRRLAALRNMDAWILPIATETPAGIFALGSFGDAGKRLCGLTWGAEDLPAAIGAATSREPDGRYTPPYEVVRALALFGAHAAGVPALETVYPALDDKEGLAAYAARGRRDGFSGMLALHPAQIPIINAAFTPSGEELDWARRVVAAFQSGDGGGALRSDGRMIDAPHLKLAQRLLASAGEDGKP